MERAEGKVEVGVQVRVQVQVSVEVDVAVEELFDASSSQFGPAFVTNRFDFETMLVA